MAIVKNDPFPGTDYNSYMNWPSVTLPNGQVVYEVPGNPGYVYNPVLSNASGRKVFQANPKGAIAEQQKAQEAQQKAIEQQEFNQSPVGQLLPVGASIAGLYAANQFAAPTAAEAAAAALSQGAGASAAPGLAGSAAAGATTAPVALPTAGSVAAPTGVTAQVVPVGAEAGFEPFSSTAGNVGGALLAAKGGYDIYNSSQNRGKGIRTGTTELGAGIGTMVLPGVGTAIGAGYGQLLGYGLQGSGIKNKLALAGTAPFLLIPGVKDALMHKSTRQEAEDKTIDLLEQSDNPNYQAYVQGMRKQYESAPTGKAYAGKYDTFDEYKKAGLEANDLTGVYGNIKTYGEEWANLTEPQRQAITQANIDSGLYQSKKGDVDITDKNKAIENKNNVLKGFAVGAQTAAPANPLAQAAAQGAIAIPRPVVPQQPAFVRR